MSRRPSTIAIADRLEPHVLDLGGVAELRKAQQCDGDQILRGRLLRGRHARCAAEVDWLGRVVRQRDVALNVASVAVAARGEHARDGEFGDQKSHRPGCQRMADQCSRAKGPQMREHRKRGNRCKNRGEGVGPLEWLSDVEPFEWQSDGLGQHPSEDRSHIGHRAQGEEPGARSHQRQDTYDDLDHRSEGEDQRRLPMLAVGADRGGMDRPGGK